MSRRARPLLVVYLLVVAVAVLTPAARLQTRLVVAFADVAVRFGVPPTLLTYDRAEVVANVLLVVPVGLLGTAVLRRSRWQDWTAYGFVGSLAVELGQGLLLPDRSASGVDVVANSLGMLLGALAGSALFGRGRRRAARERGSRP